MKYGTSILAMMTLALAGAAAHAASIDIQGVWGNEGGCAMARGNYDDDTAVLLRRDRLEGIDFICEFAGVRRGSDGSFAVDANCAQEGMDERIQIGIGAVRNGKRSITSDQGWDFSPVSQCRR